MAANYLAEIHATQFEDLVASLINDDRGTTLLDYTTCIREYRSACRLRNKGEGHARRDARHQQTFAVQDVYMSVQCRDIHHLVVIRNLHASDRRCFGTADHQGSGIDLKAAGALHFAHSLFQ